ncbi:MAG: response regulator [Anaerolineae bacterium]|nr:response regulator [Anaerolineae bacterium]
MVPAHILIVDDIKDARVLMRLMLSTKGGFSISEATGGTEALQIVRENHPDLVVLDYMMPDMDGIDVCHAIRADAAIADTPILMLTARTDLGIHEKALDAGATSFMNKPVKPQDLVAEASRLIEEARRIRAGS